MEETAPRESRYVELYAMPCPALEWRTVADAPIQVFYVLSVPL